MHNPKDREIIKRPSGISRRDFLKASGIVVISVQFGGCIIPDKSVPSAEGYLLVDTKKCQGCLTCMLACSLVHEGFESLSLARIQVVQNPFTNFPDDINIAQCRQCVDPVCIAVCPTRALHADEENGYVRTVNTKKCIGWLGCRACVEACSYDPGRSIWNFQKNHAQTCDLCANAGFWNEQGGLNGKQACVAVCPMKAIKFTTEIPEQLGDDGYNVNLRDEIWQALGYPID
jgi:protein NrfC